MTKENTTNNPAENLINRFKQDRWYAHTQNSSLPNPKKALTEIIAYVNADHTNAKENLKSLFEDELGAALIYVALQITQYEMHHSAALQHDKTYNYLISSEAPEDPRHQDQNLIKSHFQSYNKHLKRYEEYKSIAIKYDELFQYLNSLTEIKTFHFNSQDEDLENDKEVELFNYAATHYRKTWELLPTTKIPPFPFYKNTIAETNTTSNDKLTQLMAKKYDERLLKNTLKEDIIRTYYKTKGFLPEAEYVNKEFRNRLLGNQDVDQKIADTQQPKTNEYKESSEKHNSDEINAADSSKTQPDSEVEMATQAFNSDISRKRKKDRSQELQEESWSKKAKTTHPQSFTRTI